MRFVIIPLISIQGLLIVTNSTPFEKCIGNFCPPRWSKPKITSNDELAPNFLGEDQKSGCFCRENPKKFVVCFGREKCRYFPKIFNITTPELRVKSTQITELNSNDFIKYHHLEKILIEGNNNLLKINPGTFNNLTQLKNMSISFNLSLKQLDKGTFQGLVNLKELFLVKNAFVSVLDVAPALSKLPQLTKLALNENNFVQIEENHFQAMQNSSLEELNLILCQIEYIHPKSLNPLINLNVLRIGENFLNSSTITDLIETLVEFKIPIQSLNLYSVGIRKSPPKPLLEAIAKSNITNLSLSRNHFETLSSDNFPIMPNLKLLDLREDFLLNISHDAFTNLPNLRTLLMNGNKLPSIPEGVLLPHLTYLDLQENSGNTFSPSYFTLNNKMFINMKNLEWLNLSFNRITGFYNTTFEGLEKLMVLGLKNATLYHIANYTFANLKQLLFLNLENNYFARNNPNGLEKNMFAGLDKLKVLLLGGNEMSFISKNSNPFQHLKSLFHLGLERNNLVVLDPVNFGDLINLESLDLSGNYFKPWKSRIFRLNPKLRIIKVSRNKFSYLSQSMLEDFSNLIVLDLKDNPLTCDCTTFFYYTNTTQEILSKLDNSFCTFPEDKNNVTLKQFILEKNSCEATTRFVPNLIILLPLLFLIISFLILAFLLYYYRWHVRYWIFLTRLYLSRRGRLKSSKSLKNECYVNYCYDAFVSYSNEDRNFVVRLVTMLENYHPFLKLCVYERDFEIGTIISESVLESVAKSRKTLLIVSDSYAKSQWCRWESQIAEHHRLFFENSKGEYVDDSLVLIKLGPVSDSHMTPTLKYLLKTRIYLQWDGDEKKQKIFWDKLRGTLAPPKMEEIEENTHM